MQSVRLRSSAQDALCVKRQLKWYRIACPSCDVSVLDMKNPQVATRAKDY